MSPLTYYSKVQDKALAALAEVILSFPVIQVTVERAISFLPIVVTNKRCNLKAQTLKDVCNIKFNGYLHKKELSEEEMEEIKKEKIMMKKKKKNGSSNKNK